MRMHLIIYLPLDKQNSENKSTAPVRKAEFCTQPKWDKVINVVSPA